MLNCFLLFPSSPLPLLPLFLHPCFLSHLRRKRFSRAEQSMSDDCCDDDCTTQDCPACGLLAVEEKDPDGIQHRLYVAYDSGLERANPTRHAEREQRVAEANLNHAEVCYEQEIFERRKQNP